MNWIKNQKLHAWVKEVAELCTPDQLHLCDGSKEEYDHLCQQMVSIGSLLALKRPHSFWCHSTPDDVARVEEATFICSQSQDDAGPTNHWRDPHEMKALLQGLFKGAMRGRTLYIVPFSMGPWGSAMGRIGVQITDSPYVVISLYIMTRMGRRALEILGEGDFVTCLHSVGVPLAPGEKDSHWPCRPDQKYIVHFPEEREIWSFGSGYGGNALLPKKSFALRIASVMGRDEGWLAEHMLILSVTNPKGEKKYFAAAFPSMCGKTNLAMVESTLPGWKVETVGDDIAWLAFGPDRQLYGINPEAGFFGVAPGTSYVTNPNAMRTIETNTIFTNTALTRDLDVWWEGMTPEPPEGLFDWQGNPWSARSGAKASHPNARFSTPIRQCPILDPKADDPRGVPISGIIFGGRRSTTLPLVCEALSWEHGVFLGASVSSETTAAAAGQVGKLRHDPFAMLPFCGYHMGDYFAHWLNIAEKRRPPKIFYVNWFRKSPEGKYLWPGFGENVRVLKWMFERTESEENGLELPIGYVPETLDLSGLSMTPELFTQLFAIDRAAWLHEIEELRHYFALFEPKLPRALLKQLDALKARLDVY